MKQKKRKILESLSIERKLELLSGANFWETKAIPEFDLEGIVVNDGPFGLRKPVSNNTSGMNTETHPATLFPTTSAIACSYDKDLLFKMGETLASECLDQGVDIILGPGLNIKRSPLCGRNFEYFSEDPLVSSELASALVSGIQSKGIGATLKHYALNNQERDRLMVNSLVDVRAKNEIYLKPFHDIIKKAAPYAVMTSYNQVNGKHATRNQRLLTTKLREEAGFKGLIMSDWGANVNAVDSALAGLNLEMPGPGNIAPLLEAIKKGTLTEEKVNELISPLLTLMIEKQNRAKVSEICDYDKHFMVAQEVAENSAVLLQNNDNLLPLKVNARIGLIGSFAFKPRTQGSGSSRVNPDKEISLYETFTHKNVDFVYCEGYHDNQNEIDEQLIKEAVKVAKTVEVVVICAGLTQSYEAEGQDRITINMPPAHNELIKRISEVHDKVVVVLSNGSAVSMPWLSSVNSVLLTHLMGGATGPATYNLLFGFANPSGKLSETYPLSLWHSVPGEAFTNNDLNVPYIESLYVGYRHYDTFNRKVLFPFGHGLSYTRFATTSWTIEELSDRFNISVGIKNTGLIRGKEVIGIYVSRLDSMLFGPQKELKAFTKVSLLPEEEKVVVLTVLKEDLKVYDPVRNKFVLEKTTYDFYLGMNVSTTRKVFSIPLKEGEVLDHLLAYRSENSAYYNHAKYEPNIVNFEKLYGKPLPLIYISRKRPFTLENRISDTTDYFLGRKVKNVMLKMGKDIAGNEEDKELISNMVSDLPFRSLVALSDGAVTHKQVEAIVDLVNGKLIRGAIKYITNNKKK